MPKMNWLQQCINSSFLNESHYEYLLGRGAKDSYIECFQLKTWQSALFSDIEVDSSFEYRFGSKGRKLNGFLATPVFAPSGLLIGCQFRETSTKTIYRYLLPEAKWCPVWFGTPLALDKLWAGGRLWVCEGLYDLFALSWVVPEQDAILASLTAKISDTQLNFVARLNPVVYMVYDLDDTGKRGVHGFIGDNGKLVWGALKKFSHAGVRAANFPYLGKSGDDPGSIWARSGVQGLREAFKLTQ